MNNELTKEEVNKWADYYYYQLGVNPIPIVSKAKVAKKGYEWKPWQSNPIPEDLFNSWKHNNAYSEGIGIIVGKVWRGPNEGKYLTFIDCDNRKAIEEICTRNDKTISLETLAEKFLVEQHRDNPNKAHIFFYSVIPFEKKSSDVLEKEMTNQKEDVDIPLFEVKGKGTHGIAFCTPSVHQDGYRYEIIGTSDPIVLEEDTANEMRNHLDNICKRHGLHYLEHGNDGQVSSKIPMESLFEDDFQIHKGQNRHEALMRIMESLILRNRQIMKPEIIKRIATEWNNTQCKPPLDNVEFEKQWKAANEYVVKILKQQGSWRDEPQTPLEIEQAKKIHDLENDKQTNLLDKFRQPIHNIPTYKISDLGVDALKDNVVVLGTVIGISELVPSWKMVKWLCKVCGSKNKSDRYDHSKAPRTCEFCSEDQGFIPEIDLEIEPKLNQQTILLQDDSRSLACILTGPQSEMFKVKPGQKVQALGLQKYKTRYNRRTGENEWVKYFELLDIKALEGLDVTYTTKDEEYFRQLAETPNFIETILLPSFAPHIKGNMDDLKLVSIYTLASQGLERPFNSILLGPPARGKTQLVEYSSEISHYGNLTTFVNSSIAGLTTETVRDPISGSMITKRGILATYSLAAFTDLNGVTNHSDGKKLMLSLNDALERKIVTSGKAGGAQNFEGRCAVLMDSNNDRATWDYEERIEHNLQFAPKSFLSRIDLIALVPQVTTNEHNQQVGEANYNSYMEKQNPIKLHEGDWTDERTGAPRLGFETLRKFFFFISQQPLPPLPDDQELKQYFAQNYVRVLEQDQEYLIDGRYNRTVMILARVRARLMLKPTADKSDLEQSIMFVNKCKNVELVDPKTGEKDGNYLLGAFSKSEIRQYDEMNKVAQWITACRKAMDKSEDGYFTSQQLINELVDLPDPKWTDGPTITETLMKFSEQGKIMQNGSRYKWIGD